MSNTRLLSPNNSESVSLPEDVLFCLICFFDFDSIMNLKLVCTDYQLQIYRIFANKIFFWEIYCKYHLRPQQLEGISQFKKLVLDRHFLQQRLSNDLNKCSYIRCSAINFFWKKEYYRFGEYGKEFDLKDIQPLLLKDDAAAVFSQVSRLEKIIPYFKTDYLDRDLEYAIIKLQRAEQTRFILGDLLFIGLLAPIMKIRAVNCFDLFIRAYLHLNLTFGNVTEDTTFDKVCQTVFSFSDKFFIKKLIDLTFKISPIDNSDIYLVIKYAYEHNHLVVLTNSLQEISVEMRNEIFTHCIKNNICDEFIKSLKKSIQQDVNEDQRTYRLS